jgi:hypothetical protein
VEGDRVNFVVRDDKEDGTEGIVQGVGFYNDLSIGVSLN